MGWLPVADYKQQRFWTAGGARTANLPRPALKISTAGYRKRVAYTPPLRAIVRACYSAPAP